MSFGPITSGKQVKDKLAEIGEDNPYINPAPRSASGATPKIINQFGTSSGERNCGNHLPSRYFTTPYRLEPCIYGKRVLLSQSVNKNIKCEVYFQTLPTKHIQVRNDGVRSTNINSVSPIICLSVHHYLYSFPLYRIFIKLHPTTICFSSANMSLPTMDESFAMMWNNLSLSKNESTTITIEPHNLPPLEMLWLASL